MATLGRYEILDELGRGGMGVVYRAYDPALERQIAIKAIEAGGDPEYSRRLVAEAQAAAQLHHPSIVTIYDVGRDGDTLYIAMEYLKGRNLENALALGPPMKGREFLRTVAEIADALGYAHTQGIVHRDVKPSNIMVLERGGSKIMDFGIAKRASGGSRTQVGTILGTPLYMSPEQIVGEGARLDGRSDGFSLATVVYEALTGVNPFAAETIPNVFFNILNHRVAPASSVNPILGTEIDRVLNKELSAEPSDRFPTLSAFADALHAASPDDPAWTLPPRRSPARSAPGAEGTVRVAPVSGEKTKRICPTCSAANDPAAVYCDNCGAPLGTLIPAPPAGGARPARGAPTLPNVTALAAAAPTQFLQHLPQTGFFSGDEMRFSKIEDSFRFFRDNLQKQYESLTRQAELVWKLWAICVGVGFVVLISGLAAMFFSDGKGAVTKGTVTAAGTVLVYYIQRLFQQREDVYRKAAEEKNSHLEYGNKWLLVIQTVDAIQDPSERKRQQARIAEALTGQLGKAGRSGSAKERKTPKEPRAPAPKRSAKGAGGSA